MGNDETLKGIQELTGQLTQKMREYGDNYQPTDMKATINSVIAAADTTKLTPEDKADITGKLEKGETSQPQAPVQTPDTAVQPTPQPSQAAQPPLAENGLETAPYQPGADTYNEPKPEDFMNGDEDNFGDEMAPEPTTIYDKLLGDSFVKNVIQMADLGYELKEDPETIAFDFCEAAYVFRHDYNDSTEVINHINSLLNSAQFKPKPSLNGYEDLEYYGKQIYRSLEDQPSSLPMTESFTIKKSQLQLKKK